MPSAVAAVARRAVRAERERQVVRPEPGRTGERSRAGRVGNERTHERTDGRRGAGWHRASRPACGRDYGRW
ncbi:hypothetical protein NI26_06305 [Curtobacterium sp. MR_MD2014]|nr:hypothetical protein NI26_06305 [Curtobacterium sp. MR_MD2014]